MKKIIVGIIVVITVLFYIQMTQFRAVDHITYDGYALVNEDVENFLMGDDLNTNSKTISLLKVKETEEIFEQIGSYYVGDQKNALSIQYPMYFNDYQALSFLSEKGKLIDDEFKEFSVQNKTVLNQGTLYDQLQRKIDDSVFMFYRSDSGIYMNSLPLKIKTVMKEELIPENSMIYFTEDNIRYYQPQEDRLNYHVIFSVGENTTVTINNETYTYNDLLEKLGVLEKEQEKITPSTDVDNKQDSKTQIVTKPEDEKKPQPPLDSQGNEDNNQTSGTGEEKPGGQPSENNPFIKEPQVAISDFTSTVYSISSHIDIEDPQSRLKSGRVTIEIWNQGRIIMRKFYKLSQDFTIQGVPPQSQLTIKTRYSYKDENGDYIEKILEDKEIQTKSIDTLEPIELNFKSGEIFSNYIVIDDLEGIADSEHEGLKNISKIMLDANNQSYQLNSVQLIQFVNKEKVQVMTSKNLESTSTINYEFHLYDRFNNELKVVNNTGTTRTCKMLPNAKVRIENNKINNVELLLSLENDDHIQLEDYRLVLRDINDNVIEERALKENDKNILFDNLPEKTLIKYELLASFDIDNDKGMYEDYVLTKGQFTTASLSSLGNITMVTTILDKDITSHSVKMSLKVSDKLTNAQLLSMTESIRLFIKDPAGEVIRTITFDSEELEKLKNKETIEFTIENLDSKTRFNFNIEADIKQADEIHLYQVINNITTFQTLKKDAVVIVKDERVLATKDNFSLQTYIYDPDGSIIHGLASMTVSTASDNVLDSKAIYVSSEVLNRSDPNWTYYEYLKAEDNLLLLRFKAKEYNTRYINAYRTVNEQLDIQNWIYENPKDKRIDVRFVEGATGKISLLKLDKEANKSYAELDVIMVGTSRIDKNRTYLRVYKDGVEDKELSQKIAESSFTSYGLELRNYRLGLNNNESYEVRLEAYEQDPATEEYTRKTYSSITVDTNESLVPIKNEEEFYDFITKNPKGHYIVLNDLDFTSHPDKIITGTFTGDIDFQGKKVKHTITDDIRYLFKENKGIIKNIDFYLFMDNKTRIDHNVDGDNGAGGLVHTNAGTIQNIMFTFEQATPVGPDGTDDKDMYAYKNPRNNRGVGGIIYSNTGTLENFVICAKDSLTVNGLGSYGVAKNYGLVQNGYAYPWTDYTGKKVYLDATYQNRIYGETKNVGVIVAYNYDTGTVQQVYSLVNVKNELWDTYKAESPLDELSIGSVVGANVGKIQKVYGYDDGITKYSQTEDQSRNYGPTVGINKTSKANQETYYISERYFANTALNTRISNLTANDYDFHETTLNGSDAFSINDFVIPGYFPQVKLPSYFPKQPMNPLPQVSDDEAIAVRKTTVESQTDQSAIVEVELLNPGSGDVTKIEIEDVPDVTILSQSHQDRRTIVRIEIKNPTKFYSDYSITKVVARNNYAAGANVIADYEIGDKVIDLDLYRYIDSINDWKNYVVKDNIYGTKENGKFIKKTSRYENYKLTSDIDLAGLDSEKACVAAYEGIFDGQGHTVRNFKLDTKKFYLDGNGNNQVLFGLIQDFNGGTMKNVTFENLSGKYLLGTIIYANIKPVSFDHVFVKNFTLTSDFAVTGSFNISPFLSSSNKDVTIQNCGVIDTSIENLPARVSRLGGFLAYATAGDKVIKNSFVTNFNVNIPKGGNIGALIEYSLLLKSVENCYTSGSIKSVASGNDIVSGMVAEADNTKASFKNCYSDVDLENNITHTHLQRYMSGITNNAKQLENILSVGDIRNPLLLNDFPYYRIGGNMNGGVRSNLYAADFQKVNGEFGYINKSDVTELLSYEELTQEETYRSKIQLGDSFDYSYIKDGYLPILKDTDGNIMPYQGTGPILSERRYQKDVYLSNIEVNDVIDTSGGEIQATLKGLPYDSQTKIKKVTFKNDDLIARDMNVAGSPTGETMMTINTELRRAYDSYVITEVVYEYKGQEYTLNCHEEVMMRLYRNIDSIEKWKQIDKTSCENYKITKDLDFENVSSSEIGYAYDMNRLVGQNVDGHKPVIRNLHLHLDGNDLLAQEGGLIKTLYAEMSNLRFENCSLFVERATRGGTPYSGIGDRIGFIINTTGVIEDIELDSIFINQSDDTNSPHALGTRTGFISYLNGQIKNITATNLNVTGGLFVGSIVGEAPAAMITNCQLSNSKVQGIQQVGGFGGYASGNATYNQFLKLSNITVESVPYPRSKYDQQSFGGVFGTGGLTYGTLENITINIEKLNPTDPNTVRQIGGVTGYAGNISKTTVSGLTINAPTSCYVGGIQGDSGYWNAMNNYIKDAKIVGRTDVGGIAGYKDHTAAYSHYNNVMENVDVEAVDGIAGGILGRTSGSAQIYKNTMKDVKITGNIAGGIIGQITYPGNVEMNVYYNVMDVEVNGNDIAGGVIGRIYSNADINGMSNLVLNRNIVSGTVTSQGYTGGLIGVRTYSDGQNLGTPRESNLTSNILAASINGTNASSTIGNEASIEHFYNTMVHNSTRVNGVGVMDVGDVLRVVDKETLMAHNTYLNPTDKYANAKYPTDHWKLVKDSMTDGSFPQHKYTNTYLGYGNGTVNSGILMQDIIDSISFAIPEDNPYTSTMKFSDDLATMPEISVYSSGIDTLNLEFSDVEEGLYMSINGNMDDIYTVDNEVMSLTYDYQTPLTLTFYNGEEEKEVKIDPHDYQRRVMSYDDEYYYLLDGQLKNKESSFDGDFVHLYDGKALDTHGNIYDVVSHDKLGEFDVIGVELHPTALSTFEYGDQQVETFGYFSLVGDTRRDMQIFEEDGILGLVDDDLDVVRDSYLINEYQSNRYQAVLGQDGVFYNLATDMETPKEFSNQRIKYMASGSNDRNQFVIFEYENGSVYSFDYVNGDVLVDEMKELDMNFIDYLGSFFEMQPSLLSLDASDVYQEKLMDLEKALIQEPLKDDMQNAADDKQGNVATNDTTFKRDRYSAYYDGTKHEYVLYDNKELMNENMKDIRSENEKIAASDDLMKKYSFTSTSMTIHKQSIPFVALLLISATAAGGVFYLMKRKRKEV